MLSASLNVGMTTKVLPGTDRGYHASNAWKGLMFCDGGKSGWNRYEVRVERSRALSDRAR